MNDSGLFPKINVDAAGCSLVSQAGAVTLVDTVRTWGLDRAFVGGVGAVA